MTSIDQKAYLQKYLNVSKKDKKKKKKKICKGQGLKLIVGDVDVSKIQPFYGDEIDLQDQGEDGPQIAGIVDERPEEVKKLEEFKTTSKWRVITQDDGFNSNLKIEEIKKDRKQQEKENELTFGKMYSDSEEEKNNDSDLSPPRKSNDVKNNKSISKKPSNQSDSDFSPPRKREDTKSSSKQNNNDKNVITASSSSNNHDSKVRRKPSRWGEAEKSRNSSDSDLPPKRSKHKERLSRESRKSPKRRYSPDLSPPRKTNKKYDSDLSPQRSKNKERPSRDSRKSPKRRYSSDLSPPRKTNKKYDSDLSPQRSKHKERPNRDSRKSPKRRYSSDLSPPRKTIKKYDSDLSPPHRNKKHKVPVLSAPDKRRNEDTKSRQENSNRRRKDSDSDMSPPRKKDNSYRRNSDSPPPTNKKMEKTLEGKIAGLQDAKQLRQENDSFRRREDHAFKNLTDDVSGRNAKAVSRKGKRDTSEDRQKQREKADRQKELDDKYKLWNKGLRQVEQEESRIQDYIHEASKPLARYKDDKNLEHSLRDINRAGDPMLAYINERKRERGELPPEKPSYRGNFPPNRFNIRPGYRWDGVDRSNGYEKKYFDNQSKRKAKEEEAYKWSIEDL